MKEETKVNTKGVILAGGLGTRLHPLTSVISKQLLPIYNKPMILYPLSVLVDAGINDIMIITTKEHEENFKKLLGYGEDWHVNLTYKIQEKPEGIAQSLILSESWSKESQVVLILGDNLFFGPNLNNIVRDGINNNSGATIFCIESDNPERFGVIEFDKKFKAISIKEKPKKPKTKWVVTGLYIYNNHVFDSDLINFSKITAACSSNLRGSTFAISLISSSIRSKALAVVHVEDATS